MQKYSIKDCENLRTLCKDDFRRIEEDWCEAAMWMEPVGAKMLITKDYDKRRKNHHIVDLTHVIAHRSFVAGFMEGNTSTTRAWFKHAHPDPDLNTFKPVQSWIDRFNRRSLEVASSSNLYYALSQAYGSYGTVNTACLYINELPRGPHFTNLESGTFYLMNDGLGIANVLIRHFPLTVKAVVETYGKKVNGKYDWSNFCEYTRKLYEDGMYNHELSIVEVVKPNDLFNNDLPEAGTNRKWISLTYELQNDSESGTEKGYNYTTNKEDDNRFLKISHSLRKPFIAFRTQTSGNFAYGLTGPTTSSLGAIKSLNKKAISKDVAIDLMLRPPMQGPASLKKSYLNNNPNGYTSLDQHGFMNGGAKPLFQMNPAIMTLDADIMDLRRMVDKMFYSDFMLYLSQNPKTRTAAEVNAILSEQQLVIGPMLQSLDHTLNNPLVDYLGDYVMFEDPYLGPPPEELAGESLKTVFISVFAQAQRSADLPSIDRYMNMIMGAAQINPAMLDKANMDRYADLYEDRLYLPEGLNRPQDEVDARREKNAADMKRQQALTEQIPAMAGAQKDMAQANQIQAQVGQ
jgi:hypothetical protein